MKIQRTFLAFLFLAITPCRKKKDDGLSSRPYGLEYDPLIRTLGAFRLDRFYTTSETILVFTQKSKFSLSAGNMVNSVLARFPVRLPGADEIYMEKSS